MKPHTKNHIFHSMDETDQRCWGRVTHICVNKLTILGSDNGLSPDRRQTIIWTNAGILLIGPLRTNFSEMLIEIRTFSFKKMHLKMSSGKWRPFCLGLNVLTLHALMYSKTLIWIMPFNFIIVITKRFSRSQHWWPADARWQEGSLQVLSKMSKTKMLHANSEIPLI